MAEFGVDRTSNRAWKRRRNRLWLWRQLYSLNRRTENTVDDIVSAVLETNPTADAAMIRHMVEELQTEAYA